MDKITDALGLFFNDAETNKLVEAFARNMASPSPVIRRTLTDAIIAVCRGSRRPHHYLQARPRAHESLPDGPRSSSSGCLSCSGRARLTT